MFYELVILKNAQQKYHITFDLSYTLFVNGQAIKLRLSSLGIRSPVFQKNFRK